MPSTKMTALTSLDDAAAYAHEGDVVCVDDQTFAADTVEELAAIAAYLDERGIDSAPIYRGACPDRVETTSRVVACPLPAATSWARVTLPFSKALKSFCGAAAAGGAYHPRHLRDQVDASSEPDPAALGWYLERAWEAAVKEAGEGVLPGRIGVGAELPHTPRGSYAWPDNGRPWGADDGAHPRGVRWLSCSGSVVSMSPSDEGDLWIVEISAPGDREWPAYRFAKATGNIYYPRPWEFSSEEVQELARHSWD